MDDLMQCTRFAMTEWWVIILMGLLGVATHWLKQLAMARRQNVPDMGPLTTREYWLKCWPETLAALTSTFAGIALLHEVDYLSATTAFGIGYIGNSAADLIGGRVQAMINAAPLRKGSPDAG